MIRMHIDSLIIDTTSLEVKILIVLRANVKIHIDISRILRLEVIAPN